MATDMDCKIIKKIMAEFEAENYGKGTKVPKDVLAAVQQVITGQYILSIFLRFVRVEIDSITAKPYTRYRTLFPCQPNPIPNFFRHTLM